MKCFVKAGEEGALGDLLLLFAKCWLHPLT